MTPERRDYLNTKSNAGALGSFIAFARGVPFVGSHIDELSGALQTGKVSGPDYEKKRNDARDGVSDAVAANPYAPLAGSMAFAPFAPESAAGRIALGAGEGLSEGVGAAPTMKDVPKEGGAGLATGLATSLLGEGATQTGKYLGGKQAGVLQTARAATDKTIDKGFASARGAYGGDVSNASNLIASAEKAVSDIRLPDATRLKAAQWLDSPEAMDLRHQVAENNLGRGGDAMNRIAASKQAMADAAAKMTPTARAAAAQARIDDPSALVRRVRELGPKVALPAIGALVGGPAGAGAGALTSAVLGRSATTVRNALADPYVASRVLGAGSAAAGAGGRAISTAAPATSRTLLDKYFDENDEADPYLKLIGGKQ